MTASKIVLNAASGVGGAGLDVDEVFSTNLYTGTNAALTVNTGLDQNTEGGMLWVKSRSTSSTNHGIWDTERTNGYYLPVNSSDNGGNIAAASGTTPFLRDGSFRWNSGHGWFNQSGEYVAWTFRKAPKFFDIQTWTGNSTAGRTISHNLEAEIGFIAIKCTSASGDWVSWHRSASTYAGRVLKLNSTDAVANSSSIFNSTNPTSTEFTLGSNYDVNGNGQTYVAYIFAHNDGDGEFGPDGNADIVKCGSYTGTATVDLGWEPQFILMRPATASGYNWYIYDTMRGWPVGSVGRGLYPNSSSAEDDYYNAFDITPTGFKVKEAATAFGSASHTYIYIAIRRPTAVPETATDVFDISYATNANDAPFPVDFMLSKVMAGANGYARDRLRGGTKYLLTDTTNADLSGGDVGFDDMTGTKSASWGTSFIHYNWKRAPNFFDVVAYTGDGTTSRYVNHNLEVIPELVIIKRRSSTGQWWVDHDGAGAGKVIYFNRTNAAFSYTAFGTHTSTQIQLETAANNDTNNSGSTYIAYLFASLDGISKIGSFTHTGGSATNVDCGFSSGARFILVKRSNTTGDWMVFDTVRGIVAGDDPYLELNNTNAEITGDDLIDPLSSGFTFTSGGGDGTYIFYAIA